MIDFTYQNNARIIFGRNQDENIAGFIRPYSEKVMVVHYGEEAMRSMGLYGIVDALREAGLQVTEFGEITPNPDITLIRKGIDLAKENQTGFILAIGGGAVIDSAKAIAAGRYYEGNDLWELFSTFAPLKKALPVGAVATTPTTGSQANASCVISNHAENAKVMYANDLLLPVFSVINPEYFCTLPPAQLAYAAADIMSHIMERYFTPTPHTDLIDGWSESTLRTVMKHARILKRDMHNYDSWAELAIAGNYGQNGLLGIGREYDWPVHMMEHELSAYYPVIHAAGIAVLTPAWMKYVCRQDNAMFVQFAVNVMGVDSNLRDAEATAAEGIRRLEAFYAEMGLPRSMRDLGITDDHLYERMAKEAVPELFYPDGKIGGYRKLGPDDIVEIFRLAE